MSAEGQGKWQTVERRRGKREISHGESIGVGSVHFHGLQESQTAFSRFGEIAQDDDNAPLADQPAGGHAPERRKRPKPMKAGSALRPSFETAARVVDAAAVRVFLASAQDRCMGNPQALLREIAGFLQMQFAGVEPEKDHVFSGEEPGYPASALPCAVRESLVSVVGICSLLAQEGAFRHCLDCLLSEVRASVSSHGTRVMVCLLQESSPHVCCDATERVTLLLRSTLNRVPEALSLLWAGLPHPQLYPSPALVAWSRLCLPLLHTVANTPRQVYSFALSYSCVVLQWCDSEELSEELSPSTLCELLTVPQLVSRRGQGPVRELCQLLQKRLMTSDRACDYFIEALQHLEHTPTAELLLEFVTGCVCHSVDCLAAWRRLLPTLSSASTLLLHRLHSEWAELGPRLPVEAVTDLLLCGCEHGNARQRQLCKELLDSVKQQRWSECEGRESHSRGLVVVVGLLVVLYVCLLLGALAMVANRGPWVFLSGGPERTPGLQQAVDVLLYSLNQITHPLYNVLQH